MSRVIWKFELLNADTQVVNMPVSARVVRVSWQQSPYGFGPALWAEIHDIAYKADRRFQIVPTGGFYNGTYVGTFETPTGEVLHVIEL